MLGVLIFLLVLIYLGLNLAIWKRTKSMALLIAQGLIYVYTFHGFLLLYLGRIFPTIYEKIHYFYKYPFYASFDLILIKSLIYQLIFAILFLLVLLVFALNVKEKKREKAVEIDLKLISIVLGLILLANLFLWREQFFNFIRYGDISYLFYKITAANLFGWYTLSRLAFDFLAMGLIFLGFIIFGLSKDFKIKKSTYNPYLFVFILFLLVLLVMILFSLGDRLSLVIGTLFAVSLAIYNKKDKKGLAKVLVVLFLLFLLINSIRIFRNDLADIGDDFSRDSQTLFADVVVTGEGHYTFSLNAVMKYGKERFNGGSLKHALFVFIPSFIVKERPISGYDFMVDQLILDKFTGFGMHYSSDWYLNFGFLGIIVGALVLGLIFGGIYRLSLKSQGWRFVLAGMIGILPLFLRDGMAGYKNLVYYGIFGAIIYFLIYFKDSFSGIKL
jgi:oligosaccharide repeat unit polymerase